MGYPAMLVETLYNTMQWPTHVVTASSEAAGREAWRVATGRRAARDYWTPATTNAEAWIRVDCGAARAADMIVLDRGHNLGGMPVVVEYSANGSAWTAAATCTVPSVSAAGTSIDATHGCRTTEGAWIKRFPAQAARYWRLRVPAMGAGLRPVVVGLWLGECWRPTQYLDFPLSDGGGELRYPQAVSDRGWTGVGTVSRPRMGELKILLSTHAEQPHAERHLNQYWYPRPMWIVVDVDRGERAILAICPPGKIGFGLADGWTYPQTVLSYVEHEPRPPA
jgi:hypothetical protein